MLSSVVLSFLLQQETGTEIVHSQGTIGGKVTIAQASLTWVMGVTGSVLLPRCVFKLPKTTVELTKARNQSIWSAHVCTLAGGWSSNLLCLTTPPFTLLTSPFILRCGSTVFSVLLLLTISVMVLTVHTLPLLYCEHCARVGKVSAVAEPHVHKRRIT